jgi:hypothetical protein
MHNLLAAHSSNSMVRGQPGTANGCAKQCLVTGPTRQSSPSANHRGVSRRRVVPDPLCTLDEILEDVSGRVDR